MGERFCWQPIRAHLEGVDLVIVTQENKLIQNHLLQLLCLIAMEPPAKLDADSLRNEKLKVISSLRFFTPENVEEGTIKGQYTRGKVKDALVNSYLEDIHKPSF